MIKKIVLFIVVILFCFPAFAQNKMDKPTFEHLVDYANCQYLITFIEKYDAGKPYIKDTYENKVKPILQKATLDNLDDVPKYEEITALFQKVPNNAALSLAEKINSKKEKYKEVFDNNSLIKSLGAETWKNIDLKKVGTKIQDDVRIRFRSNSGQKNDQNSEMKSSYDQSVQNSAQFVELHNKIDSLQKKYDKLQDNSKFDKIKSSVLTTQILMVLFLVLNVLLFITLIILYRSQLNSENRSSLARKFVKNVFFNSEEIKDKLNSYKFDNNDSKIKSNVDNLETRIGQLAYQIDQLHSKLDFHIRESNSTKTEPKSLNYTESKDHGLYFASKSNKQLIEKLPSSSNASFRVIAANGNEAKFEYVGAVRNENWFEGVCSIENSASDNLSDKYQIHTIQPGIVRKENDNWFVITPAKIKFI